jgi:hypothetical protein
MNGHHGRQGTEVSTENRLIHEKSPYLLQHAHNPVDWYPWGEEAFEKARREEKPVFLSIGYSTCHWCHVMARESFADEEVADELNRHFVPVKVDREERPDVDQVYMEACQALTGQGGWPLTVFLTPGKEPFLAGTYFPKHPRGGLPGLTDLLQLVADEWRRDPDRLRAAGTDLLRRLAPSRQVPEGGSTPTDPENPAAVTQDTLAKAYADLTREFDPVYGGFGPAPKFPLPHQLVFLLRHHRLTGAPEALAMVERTLDGMRRGGLWDHVGFGFARYSTDRRWLIPHFEKMLYDNALLALAYLEAFQATGRPVWAETARQVFAYVERRLTAPEGAFYSAEDADSEGEEGRFYLWTPEQVTEALAGEDPALASLYCKRYDITPAGNFEGRSLPNLVCGTLPDAAPAPGRPPSSLEADLDRARLVLLEARERRVHPHRDDKILTAWNGLMIAALARGASILQEPAYAVRAEDAAAFLDANLRRPGDGRLLARYREGEAAYLAYLDDHAFLALGYLELYQATFRPAHLAAALRLLGELEDLFADPEGGYFFTGRDAEPLPLRPKELYDGALPSGNSVAALVLQRLAHLTRREEVTAAARRQVEVFLPWAARHPSSFTCFLQAVQWQVGPVAEVVVSGRPDAPETAALLRLLQERHLPLVATLYQPDGAAGRELVDLLPWTRNQIAPDERSTAWVCREGACEAPVYTPAALAATLTRISDRR